jgi:NAD(P)-dependent dehydrogenase (short-subunit alcohol dehydrogenase family)
MKAEKGNVANKLAIVTGGATGIGFAITQKFIANNIRTVIAGRDERKLKEAQRLLGEWCVPVNMDVTDLKGIPHFIEEIERQYGTLDILVNNAGVNMKKDAVEVTDEEFHSILQTNLSSVFSLSREASKKMMVKGRGHIINISSMAAHYGIPKVVAYSASKAAIEGMTRALAVELSPLGILVNCIAPGFIQTEMSSKALSNDLERKNRVLQRTPLGKLGLPEDVANSVHFLVSDENKFITGAVIPVDGGNSIGF